MRGGGGGGGRTTRGQDGVTQGDLGAGWGGAHTGHGVCLEVTGFGGGGGLWGAAGVMRGCWVQEMLGGLCGVLGGGLWGVPGGAGKRGGPW